jgi:hypothetical protein
MRLDATRSPVYSHRWIARPPQRDAGAKPALDLVGHT